MKVFFTPIGEFESFLSSEKGKQKLAELKSFHYRLDSVFQKLYDLSVKLTPEAMQTYLDFGHLDIELYRFLLSSGLLPFYDWESWMEGKEIIEGLRKSPELSQVKALKLLSLVIKMDNSEKGKFENFLKSGQMLWVLEYLTFQNTQAPIKPENA